MFKIINYFKDECYYRYRIICQSCVILYICIYFEIDRRCMQTFFGYLNLLQSRRMDIKRKPKIEFMEYVLLYVTR